MPSGHIVDGELLGSMQAPLLRLPGDIGVIAFSRSVVQEAATAPGDDRRSLDAVGTMRERDRLGRERFVDARSELLDGGRLGERSSEA